MSEKVSNDQLYELLKEFKSDVNQQFGVVNQQFVEVNRQFTEINRQFGEIREEIHEIKQEQREMRQILNRYDQRLGKLENQIESVRITWSTRLVSGILGTSAVTSAIVAFFIIQVS